MARARNIKPAFFTNEDLVELDFATRLLFIGLWTEADREGRLEDRPKRLKMALFPGDNLDVDAALAELAAAGFILRYEVVGKRYIQVENFTKHQMPHHKEVASAIPAPTGRQQMTKHAYDVPSHVRDAIFNRDNHHCLRCGAADRLSIDHIKPLASGGDNSEENLQTLCMPCNSSKGDATMDYRKSIVDPCMAQACAKHGASCPTDSLIPDSIETPLSPADVRDESAAEDPQPPPGEQPALLVPTTAPHLMTLDWEPDQGRLQALALRAGLPMAAFGQEAIAGFVIHHEAKGLSRAPSEWLAALVGWVKRDSEWAKSAKAAVVNFPGGGQRRANGPDFHSDDTSWANDLGPL